jgi:hypothetical protein
MILSNIRLEGHRALLRRYFGKWWEFPFGELEIGAAWNEFTVYPTTDQVWRLMVEEEKMKGVVNPVSPMQFLFQPATEQQKFLVYGHVTAMHMPGDGLLRGRLTKLATVVTPDVVAKDLREALDDIEDNAVDRFPIRTFLP